MVKQNNLLEPAETQEQILRHLCERNQPAELCWSIPGEAAVRARVRFLDCCGDKLLLDFPGRAGKPYRLRVGDIIELRFVYDDQRLVLMTRVFARARWQLNQLDLPALVVDKPLELQRDQQRECYRVSLLHLPSARVLLRKMDWLADQCPTYEALFRNLSETGFGALLEASSGASFAVNDLYQAVFTLAGLPESLSLPSRIRWVERSRTGSRLFIGASWELDPDDPQDRETQTLLARFVVAEQRADLQKRLGK